MYVALTLVLAALLTFPALWAWAALRGGHVEAWRLTVYGLDTAMRGAVNLWTDRWGFVCLKPPTPHRRHGWWRPHLYLSPNATPWASTLLLGRPGTHMTRDERDAVGWRRRTWGHGYDLVDHDPQDPRVPPRLTAALREGCRLRQPRGSEEGTCDCRGPAECPWRTEEERRRGLRYDDLNAACEALRSRGREP